MKKSFLGLLGLNATAKIKRYHLILHCAGIHDLILKGILEKEEGGGRSTHYALSL